MKLASVSILASCAVALTMGCSARAEVRSMAHPDAGGITLGDGGARADSGGAGGSDAAGASRSDGGGRVPDGGLGDASVVALDAGPPRSCSDPVTAFPMADAPRCSAATRTAMNACAGDVTCVRTAAGADSTAPLTRGGRVITCSYCLSAQQKYCIASHGCAMETSSLECCIDTSCPDGSCTGTTCAEQFGAWQTCAATMASPACLSDPTGGDYAICFAAG